MLRKRDAGRRNTAPADRMDIPAAYEEPGRQRNTGGRRANRGAAFHRRRELGYTNWVSWLTGLLMFTVPLSYLELVLHICLYDGVHLGCLYAVLFACVFGGVLFTLCAFAPKVVRSVILITLTALETILAEVQLVYHAIFGSLMAINQVGMGGDVMTNFGKQILFGMSQNILQILLLLLPLPAVIAIVVLCRHRGVRYSVGQKLTALLMSAVCCVGVVLLLNAGKDDTLSAWSVFTNVNTSTETSYKNVGMLATTEQEIRYMLFRTDDVVDPLGGDALGLSTVARTYSTKSYNVMDIDFKALKDSTDEEILKSLDNYFNAVIPTAKNDYTGLLKDYNLITICAESFCPYFISEELTPALYKMSNTGILFKNYYGSFQSVTTNGEYTMCMGLFPDLTRTKTQSSFDVSSGNYLPFCLGNALEEKGYTCWAYHNYIGDFYNRNITHPNMGYTFQSASDGLDIAIDWPSSDLEMMMESVDDYIDSGKPFHAYYMTFSGHYQYNWENAMSKKNQAAVANLSCSDTVKAYIACNLELEYAMEYLLERLEEAGVADKTAIVITNDHYPYGLTEEEYNELAGQELDTTFEKYRNSFICYVPGLKENIVVEDYCSTADILPTLLNLYGVEYDSRLLAGTDVLSNGIHMAVLSDGSFLTKSFRYDAETEEVTVNEGGSEPTEELLDSYRTFVRNKFAISSNILNCDYYSHVFNTAQSESALEDTVVFTDIRNIFNQAAVLYMYRNGYVEPESEDTFGGSKAARIGEFVDVLYRIAGSPMTDSSMLPEDYGGNSFDEEYEYYNAICWAFREGILREDDSSIKWSRNVYYKTAAVLITRFAASCGVDTSVDEAEVLATAEENSRLTDEEVRAMLWVDHASITTRDSTLEELFGNASNHLSRYQMTSFLFYLCTYELSLDE